MNITDSSRKICCTIDSFLAQFIIYYHRVLLLQVSSFISFVETGLEIGYFTVTHLSPTCHKNAELKLIQNYRDDFSIITATLIQKTSVELKLLKVPYGEELYNSTLICILNGEKDRKVLLKSQLSGICALIFICLALFR